MPANLTSISGMAPSRPVALTTSFLLGFSDACFITQVRLGEVRGPPSNPQCCQLVGKRNGLLHPHHQ